MTAEVPRVRDKAPYADWYYSLGVANQFLDRDVEAFLETEPDSPEREALEHRIPMRISNLANAINFAADSHTSWQGLKIPPRIEMNGDDGSTIYFYPFASGTQKEGEKGDKKPMVARYREIKPSGIRGLLQGPTIETKEIPPSVWLEDDLLREQLLKSLRSGLPQRIKAHDY